MQGTLSLLSPGVLSLIAAAAVLLGLFRGTARQIVFLLLNVGFLVRYILGVKGTVTTLAFALAGYVVIRVAERGRPRAYVAALATLVALFIYMQSYEFLGLVLPESLLTRSLATVGLSFLFFKIVHVAVEARSGTLGPFDPLTYVNYCTSFTAFAMGPIARYPDHHAQWFDPDRACTFEEQLDAVIRILFGLVKAYVLAELFAPYVIDRSVDLSALSRLEILGAVYAFNLYLYLNFAGYCDVMIGAGTLFGLVPPENFDKPFLARNISDFWLRQHRSLTLWLTDYVFTPTYKMLLEQPRLRRRVLLSANLALAVTMLVSGLWHGTTYAFLWFGLVHGAYLIVYRTWDTWLSKRFGKKRVRAWRKNVLVHAAGIGITFNAVSFAFVFFYLDAPTAFSVLGRFFVP